MTHAQLTNKINHLGYQGFKEAYQRQKEEIVYAAMSFEERLYQLLDAQEIFLKNKRITMNHKLSKIKDRIWGGLQKDGGVTPSLQVLKDTTGKNILISIILLVQMLWLNS